MSILSSKSISSPYKRKEVSIVNEFCSLLVALCVLSLTGHVNHVMRVRANERRTGGKNVGAIIEFAESQGPLFFLAYIFGAF